MPDMTLTAWKEISRKTLLFKYGRGIDQVVFELPDGQEREYYLKKENDTVAILALTPDNQVLLARQYRPGPNKIIDEIPGGTLDENESAQAAAERELLEETGYTGEVKVVANFEDDAYSSQIRYVAVAINCQKIGEPHQTASEQIELVSKSLPDFRRQLKAGQLTDCANAYLALDYLGLL
jgi:ADP-ribose pyrophosphatase